MASDDASTRVVDFLDDKLQSLADLDSLDTVLASVRKQYTLLRQQLEEATTDLEQAEQQSREHSRHIQTKTTKFHKDQRDLDRRLLVITQSETSDDAVHKFEQSMQKLQRLDVASAYLELLGDASTLSEELDSLLEASDDNALKPYRQLQTLVSGLRPLQEAAEGAAPHLIDHLTKITERSKLQIRAKYCSDLEAVIKKTSWPKTDTQIKGDVRKEWDRCVGRLLDFQLPELEDKESTKAKLGAKYKPEVLLPFEVLVKPLEMRFKYHFEGDKPTNRLDKPEYFLFHALDLINQFHGFALDYLQPLLQRHFRNADASFNLAYIDAVSALIVAILPMVRNKAFWIMPQIAAQPQLFSHFVHEIMKFDTSIRQDWKFDGGNATEAWSGLAWDLLVNKDWFGPWIKIEKDFALARYDTITETPRSGELDFESVDASATKPSQQAIRVNDLLETITERYRPLVSFSHKIRFLMDVQIAILDKYHDHLHSGLEAYLAMTSKIGRSVHGITKEEQADLQGVGGLDRLCRIYGSATYLEKAMRDWSDDIFFLELWEELQDRARVAQESSLSSPLPLSVSQIASRTSSNVGSEDNSGALFDESAGAYSRLRIRTESILIEVLSQKFRERIAPYRNVDTWSSLLSSQPTAASSQAASSELDVLLKTISNSLGFLTKAIARAPLRRITYTTLQSLQTWIWDNVLMRHSFSTAGTAQLNKDFLAICEIVDKSLGQGIAQTQMVKLHEAIVLVGWPILSSNKGDDSAQESGTENEDDNVGTENKIGLWDVDKQLFIDNDAARQVLQDIKLYNLSVSEARKIIKLRIEINS